MPGAPRHPPPPFFTVDWPAAPLAGTLATVVLLMNALLTYNSGCDYGDCAGGVSESFIPLALSLPVSIFALAGCHYLGRQMETFDLEMYAATLDLLDYLAAPPYRTQPSRT